MAFFDQVGAQGVTPMRQGDSEFLAAVVTLASAEFFGRRAGVRNCEDGTASIGTVNWQSSKAVLANSYQVQAPRWRREQLLGVGGDQLGNRVGRVAGVGGEMTMSSTTLRGSPLRALARIVSIKLPPLPRAPVCRTGSPPGRSTSPAPPARLIVRPRAWTRRKR